jgi:Winged helix-turn-helix domain (DUF2582)
MRSTRGANSPLKDLKKAAKGKEPTFDWAIGWLAREDQIVITVIQLGSFAHDGYMNTPRQNSV